MGSGLASIVVTQHVNANVTWPPFTPGTTQPVVVTGTKINQNQTSTVALRVTDRAGNITTCDPVLSTLKISKTHGRKGKARESYTALPWAESKVQLTNGDPGVRSVRLIVNGKNFRVIRIAPGTQRNVDVSRAMKPGSANRITVIAHGSNGSSVLVVISD
jgi:hypothetical protein